MARKTLINDYINYERVNQNKVFMIKILKLLSFY